MLKFVVSVLSLFIVVAVYSQQISGVVSNSLNEPIKYATIYIEELQTGTSANQDGKYALQVSPGKYTISFRALGYSPQYKTVQVGSSNVILNVELPNQSYILAGVTVRADDEDPAYAIMRKAIARAPGFINQAESYSSEVYIKGSVKMIKIPKLIQKQMEVNGERPEEGETYVNESLNRISFKAPNTYTQEVISVNNSFPINDDDVPVIGLISGSIYESQDDFYISPFAPNAFAHYKFSYEGLLQDGEWFIDKIKVTPKRKSKLLMEGYLYIVEDLWCLYSYDMQMNPPYTKLKIKQFYAPVKGNNYFPVNLFVEASIGVMGVKANATYTTTIKYSSMVLNPKFSQHQIAKAITYTDTVVEETVDPKIAKIDKELDELLQNDDLSNRDMVQIQKLMAKKATLLDELDRKDPLEIVSTYNTIVKKESLVRDSLYWDSVRPVPASADEKISYQKIVEKQAKEDSTPTWKKVLKTIGFGNNEWERSKKFYVYYPGLINTKNIGFNPVDGLQLMQSFKMRWVTDSVNVFHWYGTLGYAWHRESLYGKTRVNYNYAPKVRAALNIQAGYLARDFNNSFGADEQVNALFNLFFKENYTKLYLDTYVDAVNRVDVANGLELFTGIKWQQTDSLSNNTNYSFAFPNKNYEANLPVNKTVGLENIEPSSVFQLRLGLAFTPRHYYKYNSKGRKYYTETKFPTFTLNYQTGIPFNNDYSKYHHVDFSVHQNIDLYTVASFKYKITAGAFQGVEHLHFSNFKHFNTNEIPFTDGEFKNNFFLLNNYEYSTASQYVEAHFKYSTQFLLLKRLPILSNQFWTENLYANLLFVDRHSPYYEAGYSMGQILFAGEVGVFTGFKGSDFHVVGVRAVFDF